MVADNTLFMWLTCFLYTAFTLIRLRFHQLAGQEKNHVEYSENKSAKLLLDGLILIEVGIYFGYVILTIYDPAAVPFSLRTPMVIRLFGLGIGGMGLLLLLWVHRHLGKNFSMHILIRSHQQLIQDGPYRLVRHPMYTAFILFNLGVILAAANWLIAVTWGLGLGITLAYRIPREEAALITKFGDAYVFYQRHTGLLIPKRKKENLSPLVSEQPITETGSDPSQLL